ncbi:hypothetical protein ONZ45_g776 [Pleurotus djamor]|nr:hypothetical protein ONZ45_g776 [Pleurotus djamor]
MATMDFFLEPNNLENATFVSPSGDACYTITTSDLPGERGRTSQLQRMLGSSTRTEECSDLKRQAVDCVLFVADVDWKSKRRPTPTTIRSHAIGGSATTTNVETTNAVELDECPVLEASAFLYKRKRFSSSRYFQDGEETYRWKFKRHCYQLTHKNSNTEIARYTIAPVTEGSFKGEKTLQLTVQPTQYQVNIDLIVLSLIILERKRRERGGDGTKLTVDEEPQGEGCADGE